MLLAVRAWQNQAGFTSVQLTTPCGLKSHEPAISLCVWGWTYWMTSISLHENISCASGVVGLLVASTMIRELKQSRQEKKK